MRETQGDQVRSVVETSVRPSLSPTRSPTSRNAADPHRIGQATGLMMQRLGLSDERAFTFLKRLSSERNTKMRVLSQELVEAANREAITGGDRASTS
jgi:hypothetical protein